MLEVDGWIKGKAHEGGVVIWEELEVGRLRGILDQGRDVVGGLDREDDLDPTVTTERVGFGTAGGGARGVYALCKQGLGDHGKEGSKNSIDLERSTKAKRSEGR